MPQPRCARSSRFRTLAFALVGGFAALLASTPAFAQRLTSLPQTKLKALSVAGGKAGSSFDVKVTSGDQLSDLNKMVFNHSGITATPKTTTKAGKTTPVANTFTVKIANNVPTGLYDVRVAGKFGLSNPRTFVVGSRNELAEKEPNDDESKATPVPLNSTVNGALIARAEVDYYKFDAKQGQTVVIDCRAQRIDSRMSPVLEVIGPDGRRMAYARNGYRDDPIVHLTIPTNGTYYVKTYDFTYQNGPEYFYRLSIHTGPHIEFVLPPAGVKGTNGKFTLYGHNLPGGKPSDQVVNGRKLQQLDVQIDVPSERTLQAAENLKPHEAGVDTFSYVLKSSAGDSNPYPIYFAEAQVVREQEPNDDAKQAQAIKLPVEIAGQFQAEGDIDTYTFTAKAKEVYYIDVFSQRLGTLADPYLKVEQITETKAGERVRTLTSSDDTNARVTNAALNTTTDDPTYQFKVPADGTYRVSVRDRYFEGRGNPRLIYRLSIRKPTPDFRVVALPMTPGRGRNQPGTDGILALRKGENLIARVFLFRQDGFNGDVNLSVEGLPKGVTCPGAGIGAGQNDAFLIFTANEKAENWSGLIRIVAKAEVKDPAKAAEVTKADAAVASAEKALPALRKTVQTAESPLKNLVAQLKQAKAAAAKNPKNKSLSSKVTSIQKQHDAAMKKVKAAKATLAAGEKKLADAKTALAKAKTDLQASIKTVTREVRPATFVWSPVRNQGATTIRVARSLGLSVMGESAPLQMHSDVNRVEVNQGRQVLFPVAIARRNGFNKNFNVTVEGLPRNSNITFTVKPIAAKTKSELYAVQVKPNAKPGIYTIFLKATAQVAYRPNLDKLADAKKEQTAAAKEVTAAAAAVKAANTAATKANTQSAADARAVTTATAAQQTAQKNVTSAQTALKQAQTAQTTAAKTLANATAAVKAAQTKLDAAKKASAAKPKDANLKKAVDAAQQELTKATTVEATAKTAKAKADQAVATQQANAKKAADALTAATNALTAARAKAKASASAKTKAAATAKAAADRSKKATAGKRTVDRKVQAAERASRAQNINVYPTSTPLILEVKKAPATISASVGGGGNVKRGKSLDVKVTIKRINGFEGPVALSLPLPPGVKGLTAANVTIPAGKTTGNLKIAAAGDATMGQLANMVVRATGEFNGKAAVDAAIKIKVNK